MEVVFSIQPAVLIALLTVVSMPTFEFLIPSRPTGECRSVSLLLPQGHSSVGTKPVVFCTDGQSLRFFWRDIDQQIANGILPEIAMVGIHSASERSKEYTLDRPSPRLPALERFFVGELADWLRSEFRWNAARERTAIFGCSHGAAFALTMAARHRQLYVFVMAFSIVGSYEEFKCGSEANPRFYLTAGTREKLPKRNAQRLAKDLKRASIEHVRTERSGGHDAKIWRSELPLAIEWAFGGGRLNSSETS